MKDETDTRIKMKLFAVTFLAKLKALLLLSSITTGIIIIFFMEHGLSYQGYLPIRLVLKSRQSNMYGDYFAYETSKRGASILIIVLSATVKYERREGIRKTWWKDCQKYDQVVCKFMIDALNETENNYRILQEMNRNKDIIISPIKKGMLFGHRILFAMQWSLHHYNFDYLMRIDDDVFLCIEHVLHRYRLIPRTNFMSGVLHCAEEGMVYIDEGIVTFSQDIVRLFLSQDPDYLYCHTYGDQTYSTWINDLNLNASELYHIETQIHHHPPASRVPKLRRLRRLCSRFIAIHGVYSRDMKRFWNRRGRGSFPSSTGLAKVNELCPYVPTYNWTKFPGIYAFQPKLCNDPEAWTGVKKVLFSRE